MLCAALPLSALYGLWHAIGRGLSIPVVQSLAASGLPLGRTLRSILLLPVLLAVAITDLVARRLSVDLDWTSPFVRRHYELQRRAP
jgi:hypothetical protein